MQTAVPDAANIDAVYRTMVKVWIVMLVATILFFSMTVIIGQYASRTTGLDSPFFVYLTVGLGLFYFSLSFTYSRRYRKKAIEQRSLRLALVALLLTLGMCEVTSLFGVVLFFATRSRYYFLLFVLGVLGLVLHVPKKAHLKFEI